MLSHQEIFDKSARGVIAQGRQCKENHICSYAGPDNTACGVGHLVPREVAERWNSYGTFTIYAIRSRRPASPAQKVEVDLRAAGISIDDETMDLVEALQNAHDDAPNGETFLAAYKADMTQVAGRFGLATDVLYA